MEQTVQQVLSSSHPDFFPRSAIWITCNNYTYNPHSNECGARTLLALSIQAIHPNPHENILLPYMHQNIANIGCTWIATSLLNSYIPESPLHDLVSSTEYPTTQRLTAPATPRSLIQWIDSEESHPRQDGKTSVREPRLASQLSTSNPPTAVLDFSQPSDPSGNVSSLIDSPKAHTSSPLSTINTPKISG